MTNALKGGWGIAIYAISYLAWSGIALYGIPTIAGKCAEVAAIVLVSFAAGASLRFQSVRKILPYSLLWAATAIALDAIYSVPFAGTAMYWNPYLWISYALIALVPLAGAYVSAS